ncbi:hypothetical protein THITH_08395 [Thioalkalivibrio paradoxus ARh 1]|uniref:Uncharacterized protein n=2 Tax=Thioalkalivibrio paradoxus TaxID=108010 RepID=W0DNM7_9GAMM|nr:hypothetical protein THITH_08395 [Thioalkalivibrio paradoxus ARh 1]
MDSMIDAVLSREVLALAILGFLAFYIACSLGARTRWLTLRSVLCGMLGAVIGTLVGIGAALI